MVYVDGPDSGFQCNYHHAFGEGASQEQVYRRVRDCVSSVVEGFNSTLCVKAAVGCEVADRGSRALIAPFRPQICVRADWIGEVVHAVWPGGRFIVVRAHRCALSHGRHHPARHPRPPGRPLRAPPAQHIRVCLLHSGSPPRWRRRTQSRLHLLVPLTRCFPAPPQIYKERIFDLLRDPVRQAPLSIHEDSTQGIYVRGLSEFLGPSQPLCG